jgi:hypothetical protein
MVELQEDLMAHGAAFQAREDTLRAQARAAEERLETWARLHH